MAGALAWDTQLKHTTPICSQLLLNTRNLQNSHVTPAHKLKPPAMRWQQQPCRGTTYHITHLLTPVHKFHLSHTQPANSHSHLQCNLHLQTNLHQGDGSSLATGQLLHQFLLLLLHGLLCVLQLIPHLLHLLLLFLLQPLDDLACLLQLLLVWRKQEELKINLTQNWKLDKREVQGCQTTSKKDKVRHLARAAEWLYRMSFASTDSPFHPIKVCHLLKVRSVLQNSI